jgi:succinate dehydrogenase hydrophobic anchor subunit
MQTTATPKSTDAQKLLTLQLVTGALSASVFLHLYLTYEAVRRNAQIESAIPSLEHPMAQVFMILSAVIVVIAVVVPNTIIKNVRKKTPQGPLPIEALFSAMIIRFALFEFVSVLGLIVGMGSKDMNYSLAASAVTLIGFATFFPTTDKIRQLTNSTQSI